MTEPDRFGFGIVPHRTLTPSQLGRVRAHFAWWANTHRLPALQPPPNFDEVRWNDKFTHVYVTKLSGMDRIFDPAKPVSEGITWAVYDRKVTPAANLLDIIHEVVGEVVL